MAKISKSTLTVLIIAVGVTAVLGLKWYKTRQQAKVPVDTAKTVRVKGNPAGKLHVIEYIDFQCPACAQGAQVLKGYVKQFPQDIYLEMRYFPLTNIHTHALLSARYAECAAQQGQFWPFQDLLVEQQNRWKALNDAQPAFVEFAQTASLDMTKLETCLKDPKIEEFIFDDKIKGQALGVQSTPTYFINGEMVVGSKSLTEKLTAVFQSSVR